MPQKSRFDSYLAMVVVFVGIAACSNPTDTKEATDKIIGQGFARSVPAPNTAIGTGLLVGPGLLFPTQVVQGKQSCEGAIGSILPPLSGQCAISAFSVPMFALERTRALMSGKSFNENHVYLSGIDNFWVGQNKDNDCWAAALETARDFLHLHHVSQDYMIDATQRICPRLHTQPGGAEAYQIAYAISSLLSQYDKAHTNPHFCSDERCMVQSLASGHPIIILLSGHAVLLIGMDYVIGNSRDEPIIDHLFILDPDPSSGRDVKTWTSFSLCKADALLSY